MLLVADDIADEDVDEDAERGDGRGLGHEAEGNCDGHGDLLLMGGCRLLTSAAGRPLTETITVLALRLPDGRFEVCTVTRVPFGPLIVGIRGGSVARNGGAPPGVFGGSPVPRNPGRGRRMMCFMLLLLPLWAGRVG